MKLKTLIDIAKDIRDEWRDQPLSVWADDAALDHYMAWEPTPKPTRLGYYLIAIWDKYVIAPCRTWKIHTCTHPNMEDESYGGPDSGCMAASCPDCGWSFHHTLY